MVKLKIYEYMLQQLESCKELDLLSATSCSSHCMHGLPGTLVPKATNAIAFTQSFRQIKQPRCPATSPMTAVFIPIMRMLMTKVGQPSMIAREKFDVKFDRFNSWMRMCQPSTAHFVKFRGHIASVQMQDNPSRVSERPWHS